MGAVLRGDDAGLVDRDLGLAGRRLGLEPSGEIAREPAAGAGMDREEQDDHRRGDGGGLPDIAGDHLGEIYDVMLDKQSGKVAYAIMSFGGFLGLGEKYHPIPWSVLDYDTEKGGYIVPLTKEKLEAAPMYDSEGEPDWEDRAYGKRVHDYYGTMPYWMM